RGVGSLVSGIRQGESESSCFSSHRSSISKTGNRNLNGMRFDSNHSFHGVIVLRAELFLKQVRRALKLWTDNFGISIVSARRRAAEFRKYNTRDKCTPNESKNCFFQNLRREYVGNEQNLNPTG
ncbi:hypothetical protein SKAU_G00192260, partial [Synaphobranchus kaupii]